ncbi:MAG TPA: hypothetical protein VGI23_11400, partial [Steroidobacteraceae bacterium]
MIKNKIRGIFVGTDTSISERMRLRRWEFIRRQFPDFADMKVLDLGGTVSWWKHAPVQPKHVTIINLA